MRREAAERGGLLRFDRFMELALYAPGLGYYVAGCTKLGAAGDFTTAPELSPLFGRCLARQCAEVLENLDGGDLLEFGAGSGVLACEVLAGLQRLEQLPRRYLILEPSPDLADRQRRLLQERQPELVGRVEWLREAPSSVRGVVLANEVIDAMPVRRFQLDEQGAPLEIHARATEDGWEDSAVPPVSPGLYEAVSALQSDGLATEPGYSSEVNLAGRAWVRQLPEVLAEGLALIIDYGYPAAEYYAAARSMGTLMCHFQHRAHADPYLNVGLQDITAHVDFSALAAAAVESGLNVAGYATQAHFLIGCGIDGVMSDLVETPEQAMDLALGAKQLMLPSAMGERFQVLGLSQGELPPLMGFTVRDLRGRL